jgi:hypothetical protein
VIQCGHIGSDNISESDRSSGTSSSDSGGEKKTANLRSISETVIMHLEEETPVIQCDHIDNSKTSEIVIGNDNSSSDRNSVNNSALVKVIQ